MSYKIIRVVVCDCEGCVAPENARVVQGDDNDAQSAGWVEVLRDGKPKAHLCPQCARAGAQVSV